MMHRDNIFLSNRLENSARMVTEGYSVADIGCDHAHTSIFLVKKGISPFAIAMDVRKGPLSHADANIRMYGLEDRIETRLSDGLEKLKEGETDSILITGMGGTLTVQILQNGLNKAAAAKEIILQPQSDIGMVRRFLRENGFCITCEKMCREDGKFYNSMKAVRDISGSNTGEKEGFGFENSGYYTRSYDFYQELFDEFGYELLKVKDWMLYDYLCILKEKNKRILQDISKNGSDTSMEKNKFFLHEKELLEEALSIMGMV